MEVTQKTEKLVTQLWEAGLAGKPHRHEKGDRRHIRMWISHQFECGYCGENLLTDVVRMFSAQLDHLVPRAKYRELEYVEENWVLACSLCNQLKHGFDPWKELNGDATAPTIRDIENNRDTLVHVSKKYLRKLRDEWSAMRLRVLDITKVAN